MGVVTAASKTIRHDCNLDGECGTHRRYYCSICDHCPKCNTEQEDPMSRTAKAKKGKVCDYCDQPAISTTKVKLAEGGTMMVCKSCDETVKSGKEACDHCGSRPAKLCPVWLVGRGNLKVCEGCVDSVRGSTPAPNTKNTLVIHPTSVKSCGCEYDGETPTYCPEHDKYYCANCTAGRGECPVCDIYDDAVNDKRELEQCEHSLTATTHCQCHSVWYCSRCHPICPRCQIDAVEASVKSVIDSSKALLPVRVDMNPTHYPLVACSTHGWYCSRCDKDCPSCNNRMRWEMPKCSHKSHYCPRCGLGCQGCGKRKPLAIDAKSEHVMQCPACDKKECRYCEKHKTYYCTSCDGKCLRCDGCYTKGGTMHHKCGREMSYCITHKKHFCLQCGQKCKICVSTRKHRCGKPMSVCKIHDRSYCPNCTVNCDDCNKEAEVAKNQLKHHCGCSMLFCAKHNLYFCPACDYLCNCSINCGIAQKYGSKEDESKYANLTEDVEWQWADFQVWLKDKDALLDSFKDFYENWHELVRFLYPKLLACGTEPMAEETGEKLMAVDTCFKALYEIAAKLGMKDAEEDEYDDVDETDVDEALNRAYGGHASYTDSDGRVHHFYRDDWDGDRGKDNGPHHVKVVITDEGDDLSAGVKTTKFQSIVIEKK